MEAMGGNDSDSDGSGNADAFLKNILFGNVDGDGNADDNYLDPVRRIQPSRF